MFFIQISLMYLIYFYTINRKFYYTIINSVV